MTGNLEILAYEHTDLGPLCLRRRELLASPGTTVTEITLDHQLLMSSRYTASEKALARVALEMHDGAELKVLVGLAVLRSLIPPGRPPSPAPAGSSDPR